MTTNIDLVTYSNKWALVENAVKLNESTVAKEKENRIKEKNQNKITEFVGDIEFRLHTHEM